ncbi:hypothetical protein GCM10020367_66830 [Streptomyces sannanensis]|uniref:Uncharacterized protein n=1 Tax=Streptomyces sannanensis TaxID=285536 RepID=A0ABP6SMN0_9ACTN
MDEERLSTYPHFQRAQITWSNTDIGRIAEFLHAQPEPVVDTRGITAGLHLEDGVHLTLAEQRAVAVTVVHALAELS